MLAGQPLPVLIAQGEDDTVIHCVAPSSLVPSQPVTATDCMSRALYDAMATSTYCPAGSKPAGSLQLALLRKSRFHSPADHFSAPGQIAAKGTTAAKSDLVFTGSRLQQFVDGAFAGTVPVGCTAAVVNPGG